MGKETFLKVMFFNFLKLDSTATKLDVSSPNLKIGIIIPDHKCKSFTHLIILGK